MSAPALARVVPPAPLTAGVGRELIVDMWDPAGIDLSDTEAIRAVLKQAVKSSGSTLIGSSFRHLGPGITGYLLLKESHISIHTWPEIGYAAMDFFTCGKADSYKALATVEAAFRPAKVQVTEITRGSRDQA